MKKNPISRTRFFFFALLIASSAFYIISYVPFVVDIQKSAVSRDFSTHYTAVTMVRDGLGERLYDLSLQREYFPQPPNLFLPFIYPAFKAIAYLPLCLFSFELAYYLWLAVNLLIMIGCLWLVKAVYVREGPVSGLFSRFSVLFLFFLAFYPTWANFMNGQDTLLFLLALLAGILFHYRNRPFLSGFLLSWLLVKPQLGIPLIVSFLFRSSRRFLYGLGMGLAICLLISFGILRLEGWVSFVEMAREISRSPADYGLYSDRMSNLAGLLIRLPVSVSPDFWKIVSVLVWILILPVIAVWSYRFRKRVPRPRTAQEQFLDAQVILIASITSVHFNHHDMLLMGLAIIILLNEIEKRMSLAGGRPVPAGLIVLWVASLLFVAPSALYLAINFPSTLVFLEGMLLAGSILFLRSSLNAGS